MSRPLLALLALTPLLTGPPATAFAQAPGVPIVRDRNEATTAAIERAEVLRQAGHLLELATVADQLTRTSCVLRLPKAATRPLPARQIWQRCREAHVRVGWHYLCTRCEHWHQKLSGGYFITADGAVATCFHVLRPSTDFREGFLVAANETGDVFPVLEVLAGNESADTAILRTDPPRPVRPLALNTNVYPGDSAWCYSEPLGRSSYFSQGIVNRFFLHTRRGAESPRLEVSTDWAPGSSGSAVVDACGNAIGHVSEIAAASAPPANRTNPPPAPVIVFHNAARAADVRALVRPAPHRPNRPPSRAQD